MDKLPVESSYDTAIFESVGLLFIVAAYGETALQAQLLQMLHCGKVADNGLMVATTGMEVRTKLNLIKTAAGHIRLKSLASRKLIHSCCDKVENAYRVRNIFAHGMAVHDVKGNKIGIQPLRFTQDGSVQQVQKYSASQIREIAFGIHKSVEKLGHAIVEAGVPPLPIPIPPNWSPAPKTS